MNLQDLAIKYPKAWDKYKNWHWGEFKNIEWEDGSLIFTQPVDNDLVARSIITFKDVLEGRKWYDFFDENNIPTEILVETDGSFAATVYGLNPYGIYTIIHDLKSRKEAEEKALIESFKILERELN